MKVTSEGLIRFLNEKKLEPTFEKENDQIYIVMKSEGQDIPVFFSIRGGGQLIQIIAYLPLAITENKMGEMARVLHSINYEFDMPGFGMSEKEKLAFYRLALPCPNSELDEKMLEIYIATVKVACDIFMQSIGKMNQ